MCITKATAAAALALGLAAGLTGCEEQAGDALPQTAAGDQFENVAGVWNVSGEGYRRQMTVVQNGGSLTGWVVDLADGGTMPLTGTVSRASVWMKSGEETTGTGEIDGNAMQGVWAWRSGGASSDGAWTATRAP